MVDARRRVGIVGRQFRVIDLTLLPAPERSLEQRQHLGALEVAAEGQRRLVGFEIAPVKRDHIGA